MLYGVSSAIARNPYTTAGVMGDAAAGKTASAAQGGSVVATGQLPRDTATFSKEARAAAEKGASATGKSQELDEKEKQQVQELKRRDAEVRQHEQAHMSAGGPYVKGGASYTYTQGPDGRPYATGGEVSIDISPASTPQATIQKMQAVKSAALAPAQPSGQDRSVATQAAQAESAARAELAKATQAKSTGGAAASA